MKKQTLLFILLSTLTMASHAQLIDSKVGVYFGVSKGHFTGKELVTDENFIAPSLFANYHEFNSFSIKGLIKQNSWTSLGLELRYNRAGNWEHASYKDYADSEATQYSIAPVIRVHTRFSELGLANRLKFFFEVAPAVGLTDLSLVRPLFAIKDKSSSLPGPFSERSFYAGARLSAGTDFSVTRWVGIFFSYSMQHNRIKSALFHEDFSQVFHFDLGLYLRLVKDKRYFY